MKNLITNIDLRMGEKERGKMIKLTEKEAREELEETSIQSNITIREVINWMKKKGYVKTTLDLARELHITMIDSVRYANSPLYYNLCRLSNLYLEAIEEIKDEK